MKYIKKPDIVDAITFDELVSYGIIHDGNIVNGMPWSFTYKGYPITHENDSCYLICIPAGTYRMTPTDMLVTNENNEIYTINRNNFDKTHDVVDIIDEYDYAKYFHAGETFLDRNLVAIKKAFEILHNKN